MVCGDVYIFNGQSNMEASDATGAYNWKLGQWVRSTAYSGSTAVWARAGYQCCFGNWPNDAFGNGPAGGGNVAANLGDLLSTAYQTPICIINQAYSGTTIEQHQPTAVNHADATTLYGRLLKRVQAAGFANDVKAILYYQGEYHSAATTYAGLFDNLYKAWKTDYPNIKKVYIEQVNAGCNEGGAYNAQVREIQRNFQSTYSDITVMTAVGVTGFTGCHFSELKPLKKRSMRSLRSILNGSLSIRLPSCRG